MLCRRNTGYAMFELPLVQAYTQSERWSAMLQKLSRRQDLCSLCAFRRPCTGALRVPAGSGRLLVYGVNIIRESAITLGRSLTDSLQESAGRCARFHGAQLAGSSSAC